MDKKVGDIMIEWVLVEGDGVLLISLDITKNSRIVDIQAYLNEHFESEEYDNEWPYYNVVHFDYCSPEDVNTLQIGIPDDWHITFDELQHLREMAILLSNQVEES